MNIRPRPNWHLWNLVIAILSILVTLMLGLPSLYEFFEERFFLQATSSQTIGETTKFKCVQDKGNWVTIAQRGKVISATPLLTWNTMEFGDRWTPEKRCNIVSDRLNQAVAMNEGRLRDLDLTSGKVQNGYTVICAVNLSQINCSLENMLLTLKRENAQNPSLVLFKIANFAEGKTERVTINENGGIPQYISLEALVDRSFGNNEGW